MKKNEGRKSRASVPLSTVISIHKVEEEIGAQSKLKSSKSKIYTHPFLMQPFRRGKFFLPLQTVPTFF